MPTWMLVALPPVGAIFVGGGIVAYAGRWRSWVMRAERPWSRGIGFSGLYLGLAIILIPIGDLLDRAGWGGAGGVRAAGLVMLALGIVVSFAMPPFLAPRWFRSREGRRATGIDRRDVGYARVTFPDNWSVTDDTDADLELRYSGPADVAMPTIRLPTITLRSTPEATTLDNLQARTERAVAFAGGEIVSTTSSRTGGRPARRVTSFATPHDVPTLTIAWLWARPDRSVTLQATSPAHQADDIKPVVDRIAERIELS